MGNISKYDQGIIEQTDVTEESSKGIASMNDTRLRILYLYQLLLSQTDEDHPLTTNQITQKM